MQTVEAIIDANGMVRLLTDIRLPKKRRAIVTILDEEPKETRSADEAAERKKKLFAALKKLEEKDIFRKIDDPVEWQRKLRDEWER